MTQLVELQKRLAELEEAGLAVYAISYDPPEAVRKFAEKYGITFQLLSDEGSKVIREFGILNTLISPDDTGAGRFYGIPFPGTYVTDGGGVVAEKFFNRYYANRVSAGTLLDTVLGSVFLHGDAPRASHGDEQVKITAFLSDPALRPEVATLLYVRVEMAAGLHVYGQPLPEGFYATRVTVPETTGLRVGEPRYPATRPLELAELGVTLHVYEDVLDVVIPLSASAAEAAKALRAGTTSLRLPVAVLYQACSDRVCYQPRSAQIELELPLAELVMPSQ